MLAILYWRLWQAVSHAFVVFDAHVQITLPFFKFILAKEQIQKFVRKKNWIHWYFLFNVLSMVVWGAWHDCRAFVFYEV